MSKYAIYYFKFNIFNVKRTYIVHTRKNISYIKYVLLLYLRQFNEGQ